MAASLNTFAAAVIILSLIGGGFCDSCRKIGSCDCGIHNIKISQRPTGFKVHGQTEYEVTITNDCKCPQSEVLIHCPGFKSTESLGRGIFDKGVIGYGRELSLNLCYLNSGEPLFHNDKIKFKYASDPPCALTPFNSDVMC
ncbi:uncharacterized protein LOC113358693 [Papaver somniferum]|uniref:uncharacterized protein LOC113358693 n=1 Tax=Papaver somniferum TaxID=3469 RepID=UPI000E701EDD|nr:uncharacterized protein LOC113358693 [Papaver somniferum]